MAAGFFQRSLLNLSNAVTRWVEFGDGSNAPVHGAVILDQVSGLPLDMSGPSQVVLPDNVQLGVYSATLSNEVLFSLDTTNYNSMVLEVQQLASGSLRVETSIDGANRWSDNPAYGIDQLLVNSPSAVISSTIKYRVPVGARYLRVRKIGDGATQVQVSGTQFIAPAAAIPGGSFSYTESTAPLGAGGIFTGTRRSNGSIQGGPGTRYKTFEVESLSDQSGSLIIEKSIDLGVNWVFAATVAVTAGSVGILSAPIFAPDYRARYVNGGVAQTSFSLMSAYRA